MKFELTEDEKAKIDTWLRDIVWPARVAAQKASPLFAGKSYVLESWEQNRPYQERASEMLTYEISSSFFGTFLKVSYLGFDRKLDLTEYVAR